MRNTANMYTASLILTILMCVSPILFYFFTVINYSVNIPHWDDYEAVLSFLVYYLNSENLQEKISILFSQHNEHRIIFDKLIFLINYYLFGFINFKGLIILGNFALVVLLYVIYLVFSRENAIRAIYFIPVPIVLFQMQYFENSVWAMASLQNFYVLTFSFITLLLLEKQSKAYFSLACIFGVVATFTSGNGMFVFLVGIFSLFIQKRYLPEMIIWSILAALCISLYFYGYLRPANHPDILYTLTEYPQSVIAFFLVFISSIIKNFEITNYFPYFIMGSLISISFLYLMFTQFFKKNLVLFNLLVFLFLTAGAATLSRAGFGLESASASRYTINSALIFILLYIAFIQIYHGVLKPYLLVICTVSAIAFNIIVYKKNVPAIAAHHSMLINSGALFSEKQDFSLLSYSNKYKAKDILLQAKELNFYELPKTNILSESNQQKISIPKETNDIIHNFNIINTQKYLILNNGRAFINKRNAAESSIYVVLKSDQDTYIFDTKSYKNPNMTSRFVLQNSSNVSNNDESNFSFMLAKDAIAPGEYQIWLLIANGDYKAFQYTGQNIENKRIFEKLTHLPVAEESNKLKYHVEVFEEGVDFVSVKGWAFIEGKGTEENEIKLIFSSNSAIYRVHPTLEIRTDVTSHFNKFNLDRSGFSTVIPKTELQPGSYKLGIYINDKKEDEAVLSFTEKTFTYNIVKPAKLSELPSEQQIIAYNIEKLETDKNYIQVSGWAFIKDQGMDNRNIKLVLKSDSDLYIVETAIFLRPDVTNHFQKFNLDNSGFTVIIPKSDLKPGQYKLGVLINGIDNNENTQIFSFTDKEFRR